MPRRDGTTSNYLALRSADASHRATINTTALTRIQRTDWLDIMGQGLYRCLGWGCLNPPHFNWDEDAAPCLFDAFNVSYEADPEYIMIPIAVDDSVLRKSWGLPDLPGGLPHVLPRTSVAVDRCQWWPDIGKRGAWVSSHIVATWNLIRIVAKSKGLDIPEGQPIFVCDWD